MDLEASVGVSLTGAELPYAPDRLRAMLAAGETADLHLALGLACYLLGGVGEAEEQLRAAFLRFQSERRHRRAALAAAHLGRLEHTGFANPAVAAGWFARALQLLDGDADCVERGWLALGMPGCNVACADDLHHDAALALRLARGHRDTDLECRALADYGLALVSQGELTQGMAHIDEAMTMVHSGECTNLYITGQVRCSFLSACERAGDVPRLEGWLSLAVREQPQVFGPQARPNLMLNHCRTQYGSLLCLAGRWSEAEATLRQAATDAAALAEHQRILANCALANLRVRQGRLSEAAELLTDLQAWDDAQLPLADLGDRTPAPDPLDVLTPREREILRLVAQGLSNPQIAARLVISRKTAEHHIGAILRKLRFHSRSEAAVYAATLDRRLVGKEPQ